MNRSINVLFSPAEFLALAHRDLSNTTCVIFDVLRATTSMISALAEGANAIFPAADIQEALHLKQIHPSFLLAGERHGLRIQPDLTNGIEFDFGNSPREFTSPRVSNRAIIMTTTNGTRALRAASHAAHIYPACFLNLLATSRRLHHEKPHHLVIICSGTYDEASLEDTLAAGALCELIWPLYNPSNIADSARIALELHLRLGHNLLNAMQSARNGRRLLAHPELHPDVPFALRKNTLDFTASFLPDGSVQKTQPDPTPRSSPTPFPS